MRKFSLSLITVAILFSMNMIALEVNRTELESTQTQVIQFENYTGPHSVIDSLETIKGLGSKLGNLIASDKNKSGTFGSGKYSVIHAVDPSQKDKLDADIFIIDSSATVDHIKNLRFILSSYLETAYGYSEKDASTIASFVTVYNAVYRGNLDTYSKKYKDIVIKNLSADKCGLSIKWNEWPGRSQIVIPLSDLEGGLSTVDTSVISDKQVVQSMKEEDDKGVDQRKNMVDIKEREAETATQNAQTAQKKAVEQNKKADDQVKKATEQKQKAETAKKQASEAKKESENDPTNKQKKEVAEQKKQTAETEQKKAEQEQVKAQDEKKKAIEATETAAKQQDKADKKQAEAQAERTEIAKDQQKLLQEAIEEATNKNAIIGLKVTDSKADMSGMVKVDSVTGEIIRESPVTVIRGRTILSAKPTDETTKENVSNSEQLIYLAICGSNEGNGTVKLCILDGNKMEIQQESNEVVAEKSVLVQDGETYYCVIQNEKDWVIGKYNSSLKLLLKSKLTVAEDTPITVTSKGIIVTNSKGIVKLLSLNDLSAVSKPIDTTNAK